MLRPERLLSVAAASLLLGCGGESLEPSASGELSSNVAVSHAEGNKLLTVMTRNLYLGADLRPVFAALASRTNVVPATSSVWAKIQTTNFPLRATALAEEIAATQPEIIGLQEVFLWRWGAPDSLLPGGGEPATMVVYDFVETLLSELASRGLTYEVASEIEHSDVELPAIDRLRGASATQFLVDIRATDRDVILTRADLHTANPTSGHFRPEHLFPLPGTNRFLLRGWASVEVKFRGEWLRLVDAHVEQSRPGNGFFNAMQIAELVDLLSREPRPVVLLGDLNTAGALAENRGSAAYGDLVVRGRFTDSWHALHPAERGFTCCQAETLTNLASQLRERPDFILFRGPISARAAALVGADPAERVDGLWASDHAGLVGVLRLEKQKLFAGR